MADVSVATVQGQHPLHRLTVIGMIKAPPSRCTPLPSAAAANDPEKTSCGDEGIVRSMVYDGVVEGSFEAGFLISVRIGGSHAPFRGVVFQPRKVVVVTSANDDAPQAKMYQRRAILVPVSYDGFGPHLPPVAPTSSYAADVEGKLVPKQYQFGGNLGGW